MNLIQLEKGQIDELQIVGRGGKRFPEDFEEPTEVRLGKAQTGDDYLLRDGEKTWLVAGARETDDAVLQQVCGANSPRIVWVQSRIGSEKLRLQVHRFGFKLDGLRLNIGVDEAAAESVGAMMSRRGSSVEQRIQWLAEQCLLASTSADQKSRVLISGPRTEEREDEDLEAFVIHGHSLRVFVQKEYDNEREVETWMVDKVTRTTRSSGTNALALGCGTIEFVDGSHAARVRATFETKLDEIRGDRETSFLKLWDAYGRLEFEETLNEARRIGVLAYEGWAYTDDGKIRFDLEEPKRFEGQGPRIDALEVAAEPPRILTANGRPNLGASSSKKSSVDELDRRTYSVWGEFDEEASNLKRGRVVIESPREDTKPPEQGYLYSSLRGNETNRDRRKAAREKLEKGENPMPQLALLLEEGTVSSARPGNIEALTPAVDEKVFGADRPNHSQKEAIRTALNTPDLALIQGPPGTGKTTVIRAIVGRLDEISANETGETRKVLLSGFQHEAVKNVVEGLEVHGVPAVKFGGRYGEDSYRSRMGELEKERQQIVEKLEERIPENSPTKLRRRVEELRTNYVVAPRPPAETVTLLERVLELAREYLTTELRQELRRLIGVCRRETSNVELTPEKSRMIARVRSLRSEAEAFADDGARNAGRLLMEVTRGGATEKFGIGLTSDEQMLLERVAYTDGDIRQGDLEAVAELRHRLLEELIVTDERRHRRPEVRREVTEVLTQVSEELVRRQKQSEGGVEAVAAEFHDALDRQPFDYRQAIYEMTPVWGATCQQAASHGLARVRTDEELEYDTVIIDEAARANPLDLLIPMTQAKHRIILVGDHRQLPHIVDRKLQRRLDDEIESSARKEAVGEWFREKIEESLFEHLRDVLLRRSRHDGFEYAVSLDSQYRTHPALGDFISTNFYDDEDGIELRSPRPAEDFKHQLPRFEGKVAAWIDVPRTRGKEDRPGTSKARPVEAKSLVRHLGELIDHPAAEGLSFGVMTYYGGQRDVLWREMSEAGLADETDEGFEIAEEYRYLEGDEGLEERLRVGTVDAFQGREFDVVFLSMVRSNDKSDETTREKRRKYGHLMSPNRMNVSMSRQKRLLIVVGDSGMLDAPHAEGAIGPLVNFYRNLCGGEHGVVIGDN